MDMAGKPEPNHAPRSTIEILDSDDSNESFFEFGNEEEFSIIRIDDNDIDIDTDASTSDEIDVVGYESPVEIIDVESIDSPGSSPNGNQFMSKRPRIDSLGDIKDEPLSTLFTPIKTEDSYSEIPVTSESSASTSIQNGHSESPLNSIQTTNTNPEKNCRTSDLSDSTISTLIETSNPNSQVSVPTGLSQLSVISSQTINADIQENCQMSDFSDPVTSVPIQTSNPTKSSIITDLFQLAATSVQSVTSKSQELCRKSDLSDPVTSVPIQMSKLSVVTDSSEIPVISIPENGQEIPQTFDISNPVPLIPSQDSNINSESCIISDISRIPVISTVQPNSQKKSQLSDVSNSNISVPVQTQNPITEPSVITSSSQMRVVAIETTDQNTLKKSLTCVDSNQVVSIPIATSNPTSKSSIDTDLSQLPVISIQSINSNSQEVPESSVICKPESIPIEIVHPKSQKKSQPSVVSNPMSVPIQTSNHSNAESSVVTNPPKLSLLSIQPFNNTSQSSIIGKPLSFIPVQASDLSNPHVKSGQRVFIIRATNPQSLFTKPRIITTTSPSNLFIIQNPHPSSTPKPTSSIPVVSKSSPLPTAPSHPSNSTAKTSVVTVPSSSVVIQAPKLNAQTSDVTKSKLPTQTPTSNSDNQPKCTANTKATSNPSSTSQKKSSLADSLPKIDSPLEAFKTVFPDEIVTRIVESTNQRIRRKIRELTEGNQQAASHHHETSHTEINALFSIFFYSAVFNNHRMLIKEMWSEEFGIALYRAAFTRIRFSYLTTIITFEKPTSDDLAEPQADQSEAIKELWSIFAEKVTACYKSPSDVEWSWNKHIMDSEEDFEMFQCNTYRTQAHLKSLKTFYGLLNLAAVNACKLYNQVSGKTKISRAAFFKILAATLIESQLRNRLQSSSLQVALRRVIFRVLKMDKQVKHAAITVLKDDSKMKCILCTTGTRARYMCHRCCNRMCDNHRSGLCVECEISQE